MLTAFSRCSTLASTDGTGLADTTVTGKKSINNSKKKKLLRANILPQKSKMAIV